MKFGKEFQHLLDASDFPDDWKTSAIEYGKLKKLIKNVVAELEGMGLSPNVLQKLLVMDPATGRLRSESPAPDGSAASSDAEEVFEFEFEVDEDSPSVAPQTRKSPKEVLVDPVLEDEDDASIGHGAVPHGEAMANHHRFRLRMVGADAGSRRTSSSPPPPLARTSSPRPVSVADMIRSHSPSPSPSSVVSPRASSPAPSSIAGVGVGGEHRGRVTKRAVTEHGGVTAEYVLTGDEANPVPQIRLHVSHTEPVVETPPVASTSALLELELDSLATTDTDDDDDDDDTDGYYDLGRPVDDHKTPVLPPSPSLMRLRSVASPIWAIASGAPADGMRELSLGEAAEDIIDLTTPRMGPSAPLPPASVIALDDSGAEVPAQPLTNGAAHHSGTANGYANGTAHAKQAPANGFPTTERDREFIIPLQSDMAFFNVLTAALKSLSAFHQEQQEHFREAVAQLCHMISSSIVPSDSPIVLPTPLNSAPSDNNNSNQMVKYEYKSSTPSQKDLYAWREIFSLWVESQIFESNAERDRGERTVDEAERRLKVFANEVVKRGLGDRRSIKGKKTRKAWEEFLRLNVLLLDLKRFQMANIDAARKILKKHDKRTALTASTGLAAFVRATLTAHVDVDGNMSTWTFYNTSLPHVLLASLTDTLLPILPSLDDYACLICMSIAFKPIRLSCGHLFCVRCLVKMQQRAKEQCPLCRSPSVLLANKSSLDTTLMNFMKDWFPKEVREKQRDNANEIAKEQLEDAGLDARCVVQ